MSSDENPMTGILKDRLAMATKRHADKIAVYEAELAQMEGMPEPERTFQTAKMEQWKYLIESFKSSRDRELERIKTELLNSYERAGSA